MSKADDDAPQAGGGHSTDADILSLADAAAVSPWSISSLYRVAKEGGEGNPFRKRRGRWATVRADFIAWVRAGHVPKRKPAESPMPMPSTGASPRRGGSVLSEVQRLREEDA